MKILHTSDLHLGKRLSNHDMSDDQRHILDEIIAIVRAEEPDAMVIAGDVYDKSIPSESASELFSDFLTTISETGCPVYISSGNHDSGNRMDYCSSILSKNNIHICGSFTGKAEKHTVSDGKIDVNIYLLPYFKPFSVRTLYPDFRGDSMDEALSRVMYNTHADPDAINVLVAHQFVVNNDCSELIIGSEDFHPQMGGLDSMSCSLLNDFDYVALGHLHVSQSVGRDTIRYSGSPLKYSASEAYSRKSVSMVEINGKNDVDVREIPLKPLRELRSIKGTIAEVLAMEDSDDYVYVELKDRGSNIESRLSQKFSRLCQIGFESVAGTENKARLTVEQISGADISVLFADFFKDVMKTDTVTDEQMKLIREAINRSEGAE